jgi:hypothetical protein
MGEVRFALFEERLHALCEVRGAECRRLDQRLLIEEVADRDVKRVVPQTLAKPSEAAPLARRWANAKASLISASSGRPIDIRPVLENDVDEGNPEERESAHRLRFGHGQHSGREGIGDLVLHDLRGLAGVNDARLDTLFLTMHISWKGTLAQYVGRLHRQHDGKTDVLVVDFVDVLVPVLTRMATKRKAGYRALGYRIE